MAMQFQKAAKSQAKIKLALTGPAGTGKTYSALAIASGMGSKIAVIDTENRSASLYSDRFSFDVLELTPPFTVERYVEAMRAAVDAGYDVLIVDSASHQWAGEGGILDKKNKMDKRGGKSFTNWADLTPENNTFIEYILRAPLHMIVTLRSKTEYVLEQNDKGKQVPRKVGLAPVTREGFDFEMTTVLDMDQAHQAMSTKDRTGLFDGQIFKPTPETGKKLLSWLQSGKSTTPAVPQPPTPPSSGTESAAGPLPEVPKAGPGISEDAMTEVLKDLADAGEKSLLDLGTFMKSPGVKALYKRMTAEQADELTVKAGEWKGYWSTRAG